MEISKRSQSAGDNSTQVQAEVINNYTIVANGTGLPVMPNMPSDAEKTILEPEKEYYFSYDKIRQYLRIARRTSRNGDYEGYTVLDALALFLAQEWIGDYDEVDWRAFKITTNQLEKMAKTIAKPDEIVRVFSYLSDHAVDVLQRYAKQEEVETFEIECDRIVNKTIKENPSPVMGPYDENRPYLHMIARNMAKPYVQWEERDKIIFDHMDKPDNYAQTNLFPFEAIYFAAESSLGLMSHMKFIQGEVVSIDDIMPNLRAGISMQSYRPVRTHIEPIMQALYVLSILAQERADNERDENMCAIYDEISNQAIVYVKDNYHKDISENVKNAVNLLRESVGAEPVVEIQRQLDEKSKEDKEQPVKWGKLFRYEELSNQELLKVVSDACELIRTNRTPTSFVEFVTAIINLCEVHDTMFSLSDDIKEGMQRNMERYILQCANREELYELRRKFCQTLELLSAKVNGSTIQEMIDYFWKHYYEIYAIRKDKMTLFLENMADETMENIGEVYSGTVPDHSTPYDMTGIFQNVDIDKMYEAICRLSNASREKFMRFIESRYLLHNRLMGHCWVAYDEELEPLRKLEKLIKNNLERFELNDKRSMHQLSVYVGMAIKRCCGETDVLIGF